VRGAFWAAGVVALAAAIAGGIALAFGRRGDTGPSRAEYLAEIAAICKRFEPRLSSIAPPDVTIPGSVVQSVDAALPLIHERVTETRAVEPPEELKAPVDRFFALTDRATRRLEDLRRVAKTRDLARSANALDAYVQARNAARAGADRIGFRC
jgi:hypothetical protein